VIHTRIGMGKVQVFKSDFPVPSPNYCLLFF
jgi:hypothetical protein